MTQYVVFIAMIMSILTIQNRGIEQAVLRIWIPFFLAFPFMFFVNIPGLPDPNFMQMAILPILFVLIRDRGHEMQFGRMEILLAMYVVLRVFVDFLSRGYADAQNYAFFMLSSLIGPYLIGRYLINRREIDVATARMIVVMFLVFFPMFLYELKFWVSPVFAIFGKLFPQAWSGLSLRYGLARTAGTFEHPILACVMVIIAYRLHRWLCWYGFYEQPQTGLMAFFQRVGCRLPLPFKHQVSIALILMALMTISRGPWIGGFVGAALVAVGNFKNRKRWLMIFAIFFAVGGYGAKSALDYYITPQAGEAISGEALTMLYRKELIDRYKDYMYEKMWTGWGLTTRPKIPGMESVDNAYLGMALQHGVLAPGLFLTILAYAILSQIRFGLRAPPNEPPIGFTFSGIYLMCTISFATVFMGAQTEPMIFLLLGWGESIKQRNETHVNPDAGDQKAELPAGAFRRVMY